MMAHRFGIQLLFFLLLHWGNMLSQPLPETVAKRIDLLFAEFDNTSSPGYAIGITKGEEILYKKGYGAANLEYQIPITAHSVFSIASVSKQFTGACISLLIMDGELTLESPASDFIPALAKYDYPIQIKHLLYNTSGIIDYHRLPRSGGRSWITFNYFDIDEAIEVSLSQDSLAFKPGERWDYCNVNFMLLAKIVEKVSGKSFGQFAKEKLFEPLGMTHTFINDEITQVVENRVTPYNTRTKENVRLYHENGIVIREEGDYIQHHRNSPHYGGSGVMSTIDDLIRWSVNFHTKAFGSDRFYDLMHKRLSFPHGRNNQAPGLYWGDFNGRRIVAWDGGDWGISSQITRFPDEGVSIICLSNLGSGESYRKVNQIAEILIEFDEL